MSISLHKANLRDLAFFFELKTEKNSKKNSLNTKKISLHTHMNWFFKNLSNKKNILLVAKTNKKKIGIVRYDKNEDFTGVSIIVDPTFRGQGLGAKILKKSEKFLKKGTIIISKVKKNNKTSLIMFKKNAYKALCLKHKVYTLYKVF
tara:strand:+ start:937 stop:1377 length:441 start_codon:yes stop_codon:yes gene_type:complete